MCNVTKAFEYKTTVPKNIIAQGQIIFSAVYKDPS